MNTIINTIKKQHIEVYFFIALPLIWFLFSAVFAWDQFKFILKDFSEIVYLNAFFGGKLIAWGFIFFYIYLYFRLVYSCAGWVSRRFFNSTMGSQFPLKRFILSFFYFSLAIALGGMLLIIYIKQLSLSSSHKEMIAASQLYLGLDQRLFGVDPLLWIQQCAHYQWLDFLLIKSYRNIDLLFGLLFIGLMLFKKENFRKFIVAAFLAPILSLPFWYALPAITPYEMYFENMFADPAAIIKQQEYEQATISPALKMYLEHLKNTIEKPDQEYPLVTTNPSMHVAWGCMITYYATLLWWPLALFCIPWLVLNILATLYTYQHYAVDLPPGILVAIIAIVITHYLFKYEKKYYKGKYPMFYFIDAFQKDINNLVEIVRAFFSKKS